MTPFWRVHDGNLTVFRRCDTPPALSHHMPLQARHERKTDASPFDKLTVRESYLSFMLSLSKHDRSRIR